MGSEFYRSHVSHAMLSMIKKSWYLVSENVPGMLIMEKLKYFVQDYPDCIYKFSCILGKIQAMK